MNKKNRRKNAPKVYDGYLTAKEQKILNWYESKRQDAKQREFVMQDGK